MAYESKTNKPNTIYQDIYQEIHLLTPSNGGQLTQMLTPVTGTGRIVRASSTLAYLILQTSRGTLILYNLSSLKSERVFVEQTRFSGNQISIHSFAGDEAGQIWSGGLTSDRFLLSSDGYSITVAQTITQENLFIRFWKTSKFYLQNAFVLM